MKKKLIAVTLTLTTFALTGCSEGKRIGEAWVIHNRSTATMLELEDRGVIDTDDLRTFQSYQKPVNSSLNAVTEAYLDDDPTNDGSISRTLQVMGPLLQEMVTLQAEAEDK